jgi:hypothetical protein
MEQNTAAIANVSLDINPNDGPTQAGLILRALSDGINGNFRLTTKEISLVIQKVYPSITEKTIQSVLEKLYATSCIATLTRDGEPVRWNLALRLGYTSF